MAKKISSWKQKSIYEVIAPESFNSQSIGESVAKDSKNLIGRTVKVSLKDMTGDRSKQHLRVIFEISEVNGGKAYTKFKAFNVTPSYLGSRVRKGSSKLDYVSTVIFNSDTKIRIKVMVVTHSYIFTSQKKDINAAITRVLEGYKESNLDEFVQLAVFGKLGSEIYREIKKISPLRRVEVGEIKVI